jgi:hypothetical protein
LISFSQATVVGPMFLRECLQIVFCRASRRDMSAIMVI